ncbi:nitroreductase [Galbibacter marinus]|uniref:Nitroreductase n=1 Tax=Galbibacter marinus TaxID=555500 RepID=K2Q248_9FLAO|nr:NAD(P)H-dependent oxidoreductase [Galbibacter marinus]EKF54941.1 nitroreductase [Galbibacter marinus]
MEIIQALEWRYAVKKFDPTKFLSEQKVAMLKNAFNLTATSYGLQPIKLLVISDKSIQKKLRASAFNQAQIEDASHVLIFCVQQGIDAVYIKSYFNRVKEIRNTPENILEPFQNFLIDDFEKKSKDDIYNWATNQAYLAMGNMLTVCAMGGIDACPMEGFSTTDYDEILDLNSKNLQSVLVMPVGYRAGDDFMAELKKVRKPLEDSVIDFNS